MEIIGQICGFVAMLTTFVMYQQKNLIRIREFKLAIDIFWTLHFLLIGSMSAFATTGLAIFREIVFINKGKKWAQSRLWIVLFSVVFLISSMITWKNVYSVIPAMASTLTTFAFWSNSVVKNKLLILPSTVGMFFYNLQARSIAGVINEVISVISIIAYFVIKHFEKGKWNNVNQHNH